MIETHTHKPTCTQERTETDVSSHMMIDYNAWYRMGSPSLIPQETRPHMQSQTQQRGVPSLHHATPTVTPAVHVADPPHNFDEKLPLLHVHGLHVHRRKQLVQAHEGDWRRRQRRLRIRRLRRGCRRRPLKGCRRRPLLRAHACLQSAQKQDTPHNTWVSNRQRKVTCAYNI